MPRTLPLLVTLFALLVACGGKGDAGAAAGSGERPLGIEIGYQAPDWTLPRLGREGQMSLKELRGKVVVVSFWASWCGPCRVEVPALEEAWQAYKDRDVVIVGLSVDDRQEDADGFLRMFPVTYPVLLDLRGDRVGATWQVMSLPTTVIVDKQGVVRRRHIGYTPQQLRDTLAEVDELLKEG